MHAPFAMQRVNELVGGEPAWLRDAEIAAGATVSACIGLWDDVLDELASRRHPPPAAGHRSGGPARAAVG